ncbi:MAG TPA: uroporphyrinogen-III C-methyltransferase [Solirubrobacteraceae bacterium]|nr:uroporphyrinogen-III C-methyltransferase [Solirubrobacteraceae bacterium]
MTGRVHLVGAGPGDPGLLTARALQLIARADVILYDRLVPAEALDGARPDAELLFVGKEGGGDSVPQEQTEALLVARAREGREVVRLKGGDPFVFGRGGEEALALLAAGIPFDVVPGVTSGVAACAYAGIPVTHRGLSTGVALVTGHTRADGGHTAPDEQGGNGGASGNREPGDRGEAGGRGEAALDWRALAAFPGTLVFYMGVGQLPEIAASLIRAGRPESESAAVVERGTLPGQRTVTGTLATIAGRAREEAVRAPAITVVGPVAGLAGELAWRPPQPLAGRTVAVTRARAQASGLARRLGELGARVVQAPVIRSQPLPDADGETRPDLSGYDLVCLTSANGVAHLFERLDRAGLDARALAGTRVAAIGPGTAGALREHGIAADVVPERAVAEGLLEALAGETPRRVLVATARGARAVLPDALRARGVEVDVWELYETVAEPLAPRALSAAGAADYITFTSASTVRFFVQAASARGAPPQGAPAQGVPAQGASAQGTSAQAAPAQTTSPHGAPPLSPPRGAPLLSPTTRTVSIGPVTSEALREHGLRVDVEARSHDVEGVVRAILADADAGADADADADTDAREG